jgi:hypothetical protein
LPRKQIKFIAAPYVVVAAALPDCGPDMLNEDYFDSDDGDVTDNNSEAEWLHDGDAIHGVQSAKGAAE